MTINNQTIRQRGYSNVIVVVAIVVVGVIMPVGESAIYAYPLCTSTQILNPKTLSCDQCPTNNHQPNPLQSIPTECVCKAGLYATTGGMCTEYFSGSSSTSSCTSDQFINAFAINGAANTGINSCTACSANAYQNSNGTACILCGTGMTYNKLTKKCQCSDATLLESALGCFPQSEYSALGLTLSSSVYYDKLKHLVPGCYYFHSPLECSHLVNLCIYSLLTSSPECQFFTQSNLTTYLYPNTASTFSLTSFTKSTALNMKLISYLPSGDYIGEKDMQLGDIIRCGLPSNTGTGILIGSNIEISCEFNFNNLLAQMTGTNYQPYMYELLVMGDNNQYYQINTYINSNTQPVKRFFLEDTYTSSTTINVLTALSLQFTMNNNNALTNPQLYLSYTTLTVQAGTGVTPVAQQTQTLSFNIQFTSTLSGFWTVVLAIFIVVNILVLVHAIGKTYIGYLNRKNPFLFFLNFINLWSLWMFYFLLIITAYWFIFTKATPSIYTFISNDNSLYVAFYIVFGLMVAFRLVSVFIEKLDRLKMQIFMINKQRSSSLNNSWRQIFIINSLAEFSIYRTFSTFWIMIIMLFFLTGLNWEQHSRQVLTTNLDQIQYYHKENNILLYFLSSSILLVIVVVCKILRRLTVLWWPYPFQNFVDYCSVTNISFLFMRKRSPEAFYIHSCLPERTDVTFKQLNNAVRKGLQKTRSLSNQLNQRDRLKLFIVYVNKDIEDKFNLMLKKQQDQDHNKHMKYAIGTNANFKPLSSNSKEQFYYRNQFIERRIKPMLEQVVLKDQQRTKTQIQSFFGIPPLDLRAEKGLNETQVYLDNNLDILKAVFPNGDEFQELHTIMIMYLLWVIVTRSSPIAAFLTYFCDEWIFNTWIASSYKKHLQKMTRVNQGFML